MQTIYRVFLLAVLVVALLGCGGDSNKKETAPVKGVVTVDGDPIEGAIVSFYPKEGKQATGKTDAEGKFTLTTYETNDGAIVGTHKVTIGYSSSATATESNDPEALKSLDDAENPVPEKYSNVNDSDLTREVKADGEENSFEFNL